MRKQPNGTSGKKPPAPSVNIRPGDFHALVESLKGRGPRPQRTDSEQACTVGAAPIACPQGGRAVDVIGRNAHLTPKARRALELLAVDQRGLTEALLLTYGLTRGMLSRLVRAGLATAQRQTVRPGGKTAEVIRIRITEAGRDALAAEG
jgi:hypothetical protein